MLHVLVGLLSAGSTGAFPSVSNPSKPINGLGKAMKIVGLTLGDLSELHGRLEGCNLHAALEPPDWLPMREARKGWPSVAGRPHGDPMLP